MSEPTTRPGEIARIKSLAGDDPYRNEVLTLLAIQNERGERMADNVEKMQAWMVAHDKSDALQFQKINDCIDGLNEDVGGAVSGVNTYQDDKAMVKGAWKALTIVATVVAVMSGAFAWLWDNIRTAFGPRP